MINLTSPFLLALTFVFGVIQLLTWTKIFDTHISYITSAFFSFKENSKFGRFMRGIGVYFFYLSLIHQTWYWLFQW